MPIVLWPAAVQRRSFPFALCSSIIQDARLTAVLYMNRKLLFALLALGAAMIVAGLVLVFAGLP